MKFPVFSLILKCIVLHLRGREAFEYPSWGLGIFGQILKMGPLRVILRHFKAIQSYIYKVISKVNFLRRKNIQQISLTNFTYSVYFHNNPDYLHIPV